MKRILAALDFMPRHRAESRRSSVLGLDELLDDARKLREIEAGTLDLVMMGYRFHARAIVETKEFLKNKKIKPVALEDLFVLCFASLMSRDKIPQAVQVHTFVEAAAQRFGVHTKGLLNAFARGLLRKMDTLKNELQSEPVSWLPIHLQNQWKKHPEVLQSVASRVFERPPSGLSAFYLHQEQSIRKLVHERKSLEEWKQLEKDGNVFQAMDEGSWQLVKWIATEVSTPVNTFLDACAAPGGKCVALSALFAIKNYESNKSALRVLATDSKFHRVQRLNENIQRWQMAMTEESNNPLNVEIKSQVFSWGEDTLETLKGSTQQNKFDIILADLPCTGSGTLHTRPDLLTENLSTRLDSLIPLQEKILYSLKDLNAKHLFVSICSIDPLEIASVSKTLMIEPTFNSWQIPDVGLAEGLVAWHIKS